ASDRAARSMWAQVPDVAGALAVLACLFDLGVYFGPLVVINGRDNPGTPLFLLLTLTCLVTGTVGAFISLLNPRLCRRRLVPFALSLFALTIAATNIGLLLNALRA